VDLRDISFKVGLTLACLLASGAAQAASVTLTGQTAGDFRWKDISGNVYSAAYRSSYSYTQAVVTVSYCSTGTILHGTLTATNLKPFFAYQLKLEGWPDGAPESNEQLGFTGRWWEQEWNGGWSVGWNLNNKGDGSFPNPNDTTYLARKDDPDPTSPTGLNYKYTAYRVFDYFITDGSGCAIVPFSVTGCYHVLWKTSQASRTANDGPLKSLTFDPNPSNHPAYGTDYGESTTTLFGEWERLPAGRVYLRPCDYEVNFLVTEESFHESGTHCGFWAHAARGYASFTIEPFPATNGVSIRWLEQHGITNDFDAAALADPDEDGSKTWEEYYADTDPTNSQSVLCITGVSRGTNGVCIDWRGGIESWQVLERRLDLGTTTTAWQVLCSNAPRTPITNVYVDLTCTNAAAFYRIRAGRPTD